ncbi:MAG TPA: HAD-IA family hydrolase [Candidatus Saccharimonadales bacterium]
MRTIIFDFDGTIGDSLKVIIGVGNQLTHKNISTNPAELENLRGLGLVAVAKELGIRKHQWPFLMFRGRRLMSKHLNEIKPFSGIEDVIKKFDGYDYNIYIMSSNSKQNIQTFLSHNGLSGYFDEIYGGVGLFGKAKSLKKIIKSNKLDLNEVVYIGDEPRDIEAAKAVGIPCIAVGWGFNTPDILAEHAPMIVVRTREQLSKTLDGWSSW